MKYRKLIFILILLLLLVGCLDKNQQNKEVKVMDKAPDKLSSFTGEINKILDNVGKIERIELDIDLDSEMGDESLEEAQKESIGEGEQSSAEEGQEGGKNQGGDQEGGGGNSQGTHEHGSSTEDKNKEKKVKERWKEIDKSLENGYISWSDYESEALKKGISKDRVTELKKSINLLAKAIEDRKIIDVYDYGSQVLLNLKPFYDLYKDEYRGEVCEIKFRIYQYYIHALNNNKEEALEQVNSIDENLNRIRLLLSDDKKKLEELDKISSFVENLGLSLDENSKRVFMLEKDTTIKKLDHLE